MIGIFIGLFIGAFIGVVVMCLCNIASKNEDRDYVDKHHIIELEGHNAKIYFMKHSNSNALKQVEELLLDAYENRVCNVTDVL